MKKLTPSAYITRSKWIAVLIVAFILVVFGRTIETPSLIKSAIVLGIGIDFDEQTKEFDVSAQSVLVGIAGGQDAKATYALYDARGKTIADALDKISRKMGLIVSLAHCNVLLVSPIVLKLDHLQLIYPLTGMYALPEQAILVSGENSPKDIMALRLGTTLSAPFFLQQALANEEGSDGMIRTTVKDFAARALVFNHEKCKIIEGEYAELLALFASRDLVGTINYTSQDGGSMEFKTLGKRVRIKADGMRIFADIQLSVDLSDVQHVNADNVLSSADDIVKEYANKLAKQFEKQLLELFETSKQCGIDFLNLQDKAYQSVGRTLPENCLTDLQFSAKVTIKVQETA